MTQATVMRAWPASGTRPPVSWTRMTKPRRTGRPRKPLPLYGIMNRAGLARIEDLADRSGVGIRTIRDVANGRNPDVSAVVALALAAALMVSVDKVLEAWQDARKAGKTSRKNHGQGS